MTNQQGLPKNRDAHPQRQGKIGFDGASSAEISGEITYPRSAIPVSHLSFVICHTDEARQRCLGTFCHLSYGRSPTALPATSVICHLSFVIRAKPVEGILLPIGGGIL
jgi:hypothetical protein